MNGGRAKVGELVIRGSENGDGTLEQNEIGTSSEMSLYDILVREVPGATDRRGSGG
jgi:hypothetical protein